MSTQAHAPVPADLAHAAQTVLELACDRDVSLATAESCTGGLLAAILTDIEGRSHAFERGFVTYSKEAKSEQLGIDSGLIDSRGAVSREVAEAMAAGALARSDADLALAITGFAGPGADGDEEGLVHLAAMHANGQSRHREEHFGAIGRDSIRLAAVGAALAMMKELLEA